MTRLIGYILLSTALKSNLIKLELILTTVKSVNYRNI